MAKQDKKNEMLGEFENVTLEQRIENMADDQIVYIGADSSFFFIGTVAELKASIDGIFGDMLAEMQKKREETIAGLRSTRERLNNYMADMYMVAIKDHGLTSDSPAIMRCIASHAADIKNAAKRIAILIVRLNFANNYIEHPITLRERRTRAPFKNDPMAHDNDGGIIITIEGSERGKYWLAEEYKKDHQGFEIHFIDEPEDDEEAEDVTDKS